MSLLSARCAINHRSGPVAYTTLNPADKSPNVLLSGGNLIAIGNSAASGLVRSIKALSGKKYFEGVFTSTSTTGVAVIALGVAQSTAILTNSLGYSSADGWAFWGNTPGPRSNGINPLPGQSGVAGDVFGFAIDVPNGFLWIRQNGTWLQGDPATGASPLWTGVTGTLYAAACPWVVPNVVTMRFDPATFSNSAPSGYGPVTA